MGHLDKVRLILIYLLIDLFTTVLSMFKTLSFKILKVLEF